MFPWKLFSLSAFLIFLSRLPTFFAQLLDIDEADFAVQTAVWMNGGIPYIDFVEKKTLLIHSWYRLIFEFFGLYAMLPLRMATALLVALTALGIFYAAREMFDEQVAKWAMLFYALVQSFYDLNDFLAVNTETLMNAAAVWGVVFLLYSGKSQRTLSLLGAGVLFGLSILAKQVGIAILLPVLFFIVIRGRCLQTLLLVGFGILIPAALHIGYLFHVGAWADFVRWTWQENIAYAGSAIPLSSLLVRGGAQFGKFFAATSPFWALAILGVWKGRMRVHTPFLIIWIICIFPLTALGGRFFIHYFLQLLPPLVLLAACGFSHLSSWPVFKRSVAVLLALLFIGFEIFHVVELFRVETKFKPVRRVATALADMTKANDRIFVWGHDSDIYFFSNRLPASRFLYCSYLTGIKEGFELERVEGEGGSDAWQMLVDDFEKHLPALIVDLSPTNWRGYGAFPLHEQPLFSTIIQHYDMVGNVEGALLYRR